MAAEFEIEGKIQELLTSDLQGFRCPVCRHQEFRLLDDLSSPRRTQLMLYDGSDPIAKERTRLISMACTNCGHIEQFAEEPLRRRALVSLDAENDR